jgi:hypothetical protein
MKGLLIVAAVGFGLMASTGGAFADPWKDESGHGRFGGGKHGRFDGHPGRGNAYGHYKQRYGDGYGRSRGYYEERRGYRGARYRDYDY